MCTLCGHKSLYSPWLPGWSLLMGDSQHSVFPTVQDSSLWLISGSRPSYVTQRQPFIPPTPDDIREACHIVGPRLIGALLEPSRTMINDICRPLGQPGFAEPLYGFTTTIQTYGSRSFRAGGLYASASSCIVRSPHSTLLDFLLYIYNDEKRVPRMTQSRHQAASSFPHSRSGKIGSA